MRVLVAPDKFRGTLSAAQAAAAVEAGWLRARPGDLVCTVPMADGGEGTLEALVDGLGGRSIEVTVSGPLGEPVASSFGLVPSDDGIVAVVEMARASGLALVPADRRDPLRASTRGTGELIRHALEHRPARVIVCIGGSATNDGGVGMAQALSGRFLDASGGELPPGGAPLADLDRIDLAPLRDVVRRGVTFVVASDVDNPLCGPTGASAVYGPQKGASPADVTLLDRALGRLAEVVRRDVGTDLSAEPGAGAAGGLGFGLMAFLGARLRPGVELVVDAVRLRERIADADLVVTGEGSFDAQSLSGKTVAGVLRVASEASVPATILCGRAEIDAAGVPVRSLVARFGEGPALRDTRRSLEILAEETAREAEEGSG